MLKNLRVGLMRGRRRARWGAVLCLATSIALPVQTAFSQDQTPSKTSQGDSGNSDRGQSESDRSTRKSSDSDEQAGTEQGGTEQAGTEQGGTEQGGTDGATPALGIYVSACPGRAVCVRGTIPHSPADEAGIESGDYILSIEGKEVSSPEELKKVLEGMKPESEVSVKVWREGQEMDTKVQLASKADQLPKSHDAWLGVMLEHSDKNGVKIEEIVPGSPASESELRDGDVITKLQGKSLTDIKDFTASIEEMGPGDEVKLTVTRGGKERELSVKLGSMSDAPIAFLRHLHSLQDGPFSGSQFNESSNDLLEEAVEDMRRQLRELRSEVRELRTGKTEARPKEPSGKKGGDVSQPAVQQSKTRLVSQIQIPLPRVSPRIGVNGGYNRGYNGYSNYGRNYGGYNSGYNRYNGYNYGNRAYRSGNANSYYYRYGGRPYYYGGNSNWYGNRPGPAIRIAPGVGLSWY